MTKFVWRFLAPAALAAAAFLAVSAGAPLFAQTQNTSQSAAFCDVSAGHAWQIQRFITSRVTLFSLEGERLASVSREDLGDVQSVLACDNRSSHVRVETRFGPRLAMRASLQLTGGIGPACRCPHAPSAEYASNSQVSASSSGASDRPICDAQKPCTNE
jgi:hypothetical protein